MNTIKILWAHVRVNAYLLALGMWRGERQYAHYAYGKLDHLAACKSGNTETHSYFKITRTFYRRPIK